MVVRRRGLCTAVQLFSTIQASQPDLWGLPNQCSKLSFAAVSTAESRSWGWVNPSIWIAWISAGNVPPYPGGWLCMIFMLVRKLIIPFTRLSELGGLPLNTWSPSWGWCVCVWAHLSACLLIERVCILWTYMCTDSKRLYMTVGTEKELHEWCRNKEDALLCVSVREGALGDTEWLCLRTRERNIFLQVRWAVCREQRVQHLGRWQCAPCLCLYVHEGHTHGQGHVPMFFRSAFRKVDACLMQA